MLATAAGWLAGWLMLMMLLLMFTVAAAALRALVALRHILLAFSLCLYLFLLRLVYWYLAGWVASACCLFIMNFIFSIELSRVTAGRVSLYRRAFALFSLFMLLFAPQRSLLPM